MQLVLHQLRKDIRQFRVMLGLWLGLLGLALARNLGGLGAVAFEVQRPFDVMAAWIDGALGLIGWLFMLKLATVVVLADSPARHDGFLRTRPLAMRELVMAKLLFAGLLLLLPAVLQELVYLIGAGLPWAIVVQGVVERFVCVAPMLVMAMAFAALFARHKDWAIGFVAVLVGSGLVGTGLAALQDFVLRGSFDLEHPSATEFLAALYFLAVALALIALFSQRNHWRAWRRFAGLAVALLSGWLIFALLPWDLFRVRGADVNAAQAIQSQHGFQVPLNRIQFHRTGLTEPTNSLRFDVSISARLTPPLAGEVIEWVPRRAQIEPAIGNPVPVHVHRPERPVYKWSSSAAHEDILAFANRLPEGTLFFGGRYIYSGGKGIALGPCTLAQSDDRLDQSGSIVAELEGRVFRWELVAQLPLNAKQSARDAVGEWRIGQAILPRGGGPEILLERRQVMLLAARDPRVRRSAYWPNDQYEFVLHHPARRACLLQDYHSGPEASRGSLTAYPQHWLRLRFGKILTPRLMPRTESDLEQMILLVFHKRYLGAINQSWKSPPLALRPLIEDVNTTGRLRSERISRAEFKRRWAELKPPAPTASRLEVGRYLVSVLELVEARRHHTSVNDPVAVELAKLVPAQLEGFLDGLAASSHYPRYALVAALTRGLEDNQKQQILEALPAHPGLAEIIVRRGWEQDARAGLAALLDSPRGMSDAALVGIILLEDPATYPGLLEYFMDQPSALAYDRLRTLPGMADGLDQAVRRLWQNRSRVVRDIDSVPRIYPVALRHGMHAALEEMFRRLRALPEDQRPRAWQLLDTLRDNVRLPELKSEDRSHHDKVAELLMRHQAADFEFDATRRQFVPKSKRPPDA